MSNGWVFFNIVGSLWPDHLFTTTDQDAVGGGPLVNVDGTPMLTDAFDAMGKPYGDPGSSLNDNHVMFDVGSQSVFGSDF